MSRIPLIGKAYQERSLIAGAQETINWYSEFNIEDKTAPTPETYYQTPGTDLIATPNMPGKTRGSYRTSIGTAYVVIGSSVYFFATNGALVFVGTIADRPNQIYMADNGIVAVLVDGTTTGYAIDLKTNEFAPINDPSFFGADFVVYLLTFFVFNKPKTNQFYISLSQVSFAMLTGTGIGTGHITASGNSGVAGVYQNVSLTGGSGTNATAEITVTEGIATGHITAAGTLYTTGVYDNVALTGGTGNGATARITVAGGGVTVVDRVTQGTNYTIGDILSAPATSIGGTGSGFTWTVLTTEIGVDAVNIANPGENYLIGDTLSALSADIGGVIGFTYNVDTTALAFDPLDIAAKSGSADPIVAILAIHEELWLIGELTTEVWQGTGAADFFFQQVQGAYIEHGCIAPFSAANQDVVGFWLMQDRQGKNIIVQGSGYDISEISTPYLTDQFNNYSTVADAIGFCFQISGHAFYCLIFPTANITWLYEIQTKQWNKWSWLNINDGSLNRHRANCAMFFNGKNIIGDWENGKLYSLNSETYDDSGVPIVRIKTFLHMIDNLDRVFYRNFDLDIEVATDDPTIVVPPEVFLSWSDDRGKTYGFPIGQTLGLGGQSRTTVTWNRLGMARDRIFKCQTSEKIKLSLNGGFSEVAKGRT